MRKLVLALSVCFLVSGGQAVAQAPQSTRILKALPASAAARVAQNDLLSVLHPPHSFDSGMRRQLHGIDFVTSAYGADYDGLCRRDSLELQYAPTIADSKLEDVPVKPYGVETTAWFADVGLADAPVDVDNTRDHVWTASCQDLNGRDGINWFTARDGQQAAMAILIFRQALKQLRTGTLKVSPCTALLDPKATCESAILALHGFTSVTECAASEGQVCLELWNGMESQLTVVANRSADIAPGEITSISISQFIVVT